LLVRRALAAILAVPVLAPSTWRWRFVAARPRGSPWHWASAAMVVGAAVAIPSGTVGAPPGPRRPWRERAGAGRRHRRGSRRPARRLRRSHGRGVGGLRLTSSRRRRSAGWSEDGRGWPSTGRPLAAGNLLHRHGRDDRPRPRRARAGQPLRRLPDARVDPATISAVDRLLRVALDSPIVISFDGRCPSPACSRLPHPPTVPASSSSPPTAPREATRAWPTTSCGSRTLVRRHADTPQPGRRPPRRRGRAVTLDGPLVFTTSIAPSVVRFRPRSGTEDVARDALLSVRFTAPMERASTAKAFSVEVDGKTVDGSVDFAEDDTVLVFDPKRDLPYGASIVMHVRGGALAATGPAGPPRAVGFTVVAKPSRPRRRRRAAAGRRAVAAAPARRRPRPPCRARPPAWVAAEKYLLTLLNCTRGGGWVPPTAPAPARWQRRRGTPVRRRISSEVSRPYARKLALSGVCSHFRRRPGRPAGAAGYTATTGRRTSAAATSGPDGCRGEPGAVLPEREDVEPVGGHYVNMMNPRVRPGRDRPLGVRGNLRFVINFYRP